MDAPYIAGRCGATIYGSSSAKNVALGGGLPEAKTVVFKDGNEYSIGGYTIRIIREALINTVPCLKNAGILYQE